MAVSVTITDNGNGSAAWQLAGLDASDDWEAYIATYDGAAGGSWSLQSSGTYAGNGQPSFTGINDNGHYLGYVVDTTGLEVSPVVYFRITDGTESVFEQILDAVVAKIKALALSGIASSSVVLRKRPWDRNLTKPAVIVSPATEIRDHLAGSNELDQTEYGCLVTVWQDSNQDLTTNLTRHLQWRQDITREFENQVCITTVSEALSCKVEPGMVVIPDKFLSGYDVFTLIIRVVAREARG